jgi:hypothetical protein
MKVKPVCLFLALVLLNVRMSFAWGAEGHAIVARIALQLVKSDVRQNVLQALGGMPVDTAANWMDITKSNQDYDFMRSWHYVDFAQGTRYQPTNQENILNRLSLTYNELKHKNTLCEAQIKDDLCILLHLMGDLHMPLHTGYEDDMGGHEWNPPAWAEQPANPKQPVYTGCPLPPFKWHEERRAVLKAELDAIYAKLYGLTTDELRFILDPQDVYGADFPGETFRVLKEKEIRLYGEYRTKRLVMEAWGKI